MRSLVSIVIPVYNMGDSIEVCVSSLLEQDYPEIEIILVDDGSKDDTLEKCSRLAQKDSRVVVYHTENRGSGPARNFGVQHASGKYAYFPDADDYLLPCAITTMVSAMNGGEFDLVVFGFNKVNQNGKTVSVKQYSEYKNTGDRIREDYSDYTGDTRKYGIQGAPWNKFFDLDVIRAHGIEYPPLRRHQDEGFIARYMCHATKVHFIEDVLYTHYVNDLKKVWQKYPVDYIDVVIGLYQTRKETILTWNAEDTATHQAIQHEYICNCIRALELSFSPKMQLQSKQRKIWIKTAIEKAELASFPAPDSLGKYQKKIMKLIKDNRLGAITRTLRLKVFLDKIGLVDLVRKVL